MSVELEPQKVYAKQLRDHINEVQHGSVGRPTSSTLQLPSFISPNAYWTSEEKERFFYALSRHSRLFPERIAEVVKTKNLSEICAYLNILEAESSRQTRNFSRNSVPSAREVSQEWIAFEQGQALEVIGQEQSWMVERREEEKEKDLSKMRKREKGTSKGRPNKLKRRRLKKIDNDGGPGSSIDEQSDGWKTVLEERRKRWEAEDLLKDLDIAKLAAIELLLDGVPREETALRPSTNSESPSISAVPEIPSIESMAHLTVEERKRIRQRLFMRRNRAEKAGKVSEFNIDLNKLKTGRRKKSTTPVDEDEDEGEVDSDPKKPGYYGGVGSRPGKVKERFLDVGVDVEKLRKDGFGLFNLKKMGTLLRCVHFVASSQYCRSILTVYLENMRIQYCFRIQRMPQLMSIPYNTRWYNCYTPTLFIS